MITWHNDNAVSRVHGQSAYGDMEVMVKLCNRSL